MFLAFSLHVKIRNVFPQNLELLTFYTLSFSEASNTLGVYMLGNTYMAINDQYLSCTNM